MECLDKTEKKEETLLSLLPDDVHRIISTFYQYTYQPFQWRISFKRVGDSAEWFASLFQVEIWCEGPIELHGSFHTLLHDEIGWKEKLIATLHFQHPCSLIFRDWTNQNVIRISEDHVGIWTCRRGRKIGHPPNNRPYLFLHDTHPQFRALKRDILEALEELTSP